MATPAERRELLLQALLVYVPTICAEIFQEVEESLVHECIGRAVREIRIESERRELVRSLREVGTARAVDSIIEDVVTTETAAIVYDFLRQLGDAYASEHDADEIWKELFDECLRDIIPSACTDATADLSFDRFFLRPLMIEIVQSILFPGTVSPSPIAKDNKEEICAMVMTQRRNKPTFSTSRELVGDCQRTLDLIALGHLARIIGAGGTPAFVHRSIEQLTTAAAIARLDAILRLVATPRERLEREPLFAEITLAMCTENAIEALLPDLDAALADYESRCQELENELYDRSPPLLVRTCSSGINYDYHHSDIRRSSLF